MLLVDELLGRDSKHRYAPPPDPLGSGRGGRQLLRAPCANPGCAKNGKAECGCRLVCYCSSLCRIAHAVSHSKVCALKPSRPLADIPVEHCVATNIGAVALWGTVPAISLVNPAKQALPEELRLAFVASGDLRDVFTTLSKLPDDYTGKVFILLNDSNSQVAVRNLLALEMLRLYGEDAIDAVIALWYSSGMTQAQSLACKAAGYAAVERSGYLDRTGAAAGGKASIRKPSPAAAFPRGRGWSKIAVDMHDGSWQLLQRCLFKSLLPGEVIRVQAAGRSDMQLCEPGTLPMVDELLLYHVPAYKAARRAFHLERGLLLPFSMTHGAQFEAGNDFLPLPNEDGFGFSWPQDARADPLAGWNLEDVMASGAAARAASGDLYGALFFHVRGIIRKAVRALERCRVEINLTDMDPRQLAKVAEQERWPKFNAISTSNLADATSNKQLNLAEVLSDWGKHVAKNGTLVTMNTNWHISQPESQLLERDDVLKAIGIQDAGIFNLVAAAVEKNADRIQNAAAHVTLGSAAFCLDTSAAFNRYLKRIGAAAAAREAGLEMRKKHLLAPPRIGVPVGAAQKACPVHFCSEADFEYHHLHYRTFMERYVEWQPV